MGKSKKGGLAHRRKSALSRLEAVYEKFVSKKASKESWTTHASTRIHKSRSFDDECQRLQSEIAALKSRLHV